MHDPTEHVQEHLQHTAAHGDHDHGGGGGGGGGHGSASRWITAAALTAAILAAFAAVSGSLATSHLTESTHKRIDENDKWTYYQSKSLKNYLLQAKNDIIEATVPPASISAKVKAKIASDKKKYDENEEIKTKTEEEAKTLEALSQKHLAVHETYELAETMFHISIAIVAIAVVAKRRSFWYVSLVSGVVGVSFFAKAWSISPPAEKPEAEAPATTSAPANPGEAQAHVVHLDETAPPAPAPPAP